MVVEDQPQGTGMELQLRQTWLKLVITPVITMRDDRGTAMKANNLHHSTVLTMIEREKTTYGVGMRSKAVW
jgi:hypothetical protein